MATKTGVRPIPLLDLTRQYQPLREPIQAALARVIEAQRFILGPAVERFEQRFAAYCGARFAIGCASGTDALELALMAADIGPGDDRSCLCFGERTRCDREKYITAIQKCK